MSGFTVNPIGKVHNGEDGAWIEIDTAYIPALTALDGFSHIQVIWWFSDWDNEEARSCLETQKPYRMAPEKMGIFATRSPIRPNPLALSAPGVIEVDCKGGIIRLDYIDANDGTPVLDIKPYTPSIDRVGNPGVPQWCSHWPGEVETSGDFDWESEMLY